MKMERKKQNLAVSASSWPSVVGTGETTPRPAVSSNVLSPGAEDHSLEDPRLEKLWHKAKTSGKVFSEELDQSWREFQHHREKVQENKVLLETLSRTEEIKENVVSPADVTHGQENVLQSRHAELKDRLRDISQDFDHLRKVGHRGCGAEAEFDEPQVMDLWDPARSANFTEKKLESFWEELKHFDTKIEKHNHYQKQLEISHHEQTRGWRPGAQQARNREIRLVGGEDQGARLQGKEVLTGSVQPGLQISPQRALRA
ncbi:alpha-2-macroglobulin receptor-associated protein-like [Balaenoptera acutorostrata]|uniref:Alpha-2-macroglobulin receptor-associated protein-like n=1 Tax=Balaenoptera acutorostrata TaxID=9767 RepID=A0ABM3S1V8_BALAC|nr:alpha-2-macroglobulin receptor-associated protein-like [Balaenoptera acutorostrata]